MAIENVLKFLREDKGLSMAKVAESLKIPKGTYASYEYGQREPNIEMINKIADFYGVTTDYLLGRTETLPNPVKQLSDDELEQDMIETYIQLPKPVRIQILQMMVDTVRKNEERKRKAAIVNSQMVARSDKPPNQYTSEQDAQLLSEPDHPDKF